MMPIRGRAAILALFTALGLALVLLFVHQIVLAWIALFLPSLQNAFYDFAVYGAAPKLDFVSSDLSPPRATNLQWDNSCEDGFVLLTPAGSSISHPGPMILDARGGLVWKSDIFGPTTNLKIQQYRGEDYLTFWSGEREKSSGKGVYYMLDSNYNVVNKISAIGDNIHADLHEFKITSNNTALLTIYNRTNADLSSMGRPTHGWIIDSVFQEIDIATNSLIFEWRASDHFSASDSFMTHPFGGYISSIPFDFYHINSVDKDSHGNYLICSRHFHTVTCLNPDGTPLWTLGGRHNDFTDISLDDGAATSFAWQHDARWIDEEAGLLSVFDNQEGGILHADAPFSSGLILHVDVHNRTAKLLHTYVSLQRTRAPSQGSLQVLPATGNVFIGWGHSAAYTEFAADGTLLCETHFAASALFFAGRVTSYRAFKTKTWVGRPQDPPDVKVQGAQLYVSWNGATEVAAWELQAMSGGEEEDVTFEGLDVLQKESFEGCFDLPDTQRYAGYRVAALDWDGNVLGLSAVVGRASSSHLLLKLSLAAVGLFIVFESIWIYYQRVRAGRKASPISWKAYQYQLL